MSAETPLAALAPLGTPAWLVGGAVRDRLLRRPTADFDVVVGGDVAACARGVARGARGHAFELSEAFGAWRVVARDRSWHLDLMALDGVRYRYLYLGSEAAYRAQTLVHIVGMTCFCHNERLRITNCVE